MSVGVSVPFKIHSRKRFKKFPSPAELFPTMESLLSDIPAGNGKLGKLVLQCSESLATLSQLCHPSYWSETQQIGTPKQDIWSNAEHKTMD